jgi:hypothetical protein
MTDGDYSSRQSRLHEPRYRLSPRGVWRLRPVSRAPRSLRHACQASGTSGRHRFRRWPSSGRPRHCVSRSRAPIHNRSPGMRSTRRDTARRRSCRREWPARCVLAQGGNLHRARWAIYAVERVASPRRITHIPLTGTSNQRALSFLSSGGGDYPRCLVRADGAHSGDTVPRHDPRPRPRAPQGRVLERARDAPAGRRADDDS